MFECYTCKRALTNIFIGSIQNELHFPSATIANRPSFLLIAGSLSTSVAFGGKNSHKIVSLLGCKLCFLDARILKREHRDLGDNANIDEAWHPPE